MVSQPTLVVPLEDSTQTRRVLPYAARLTRARDGRMLLVQAIADPELRRHAEIQLGRIVDELGLETERMETRVMVGEPGPVIMAAAEEKHADLIAMATDRWTDVDRWLNGSVADWVLRHAAVPVLVVPPESAAQPWATGTRPRILVALDGSAFAEEVLEPALNIARSLDSELLLLRVVDNGQPTASAQAYLDEVAARLSGRGMTLASQVGQGEPAAVIDRVAAQAGVGLIAMATHGRTGLARLLVGSVATRTIQNATVPLLLVRPAALLEKPAHGGRFLD